MYRMTRAVQADAVLHDEDDNELITGEAVALDVRPASFVLRAAGALIDFLVYLGAFMVLATLVGTVAEALSLDDAAFAAVAIALAACCFVVAPTAVELATRGKSLGKLAVGVRIVRDDGGPVGFRHAFIRAMTGVIEFYMTFGGFAALVALLDRKAKRLGDLLAGTYAQYERAPKIEPATFGVPVVLQEWAKTADVARMPDALARRIAQFLAHAASFTPASRDRLARELAIETAPWVSPVPEAEPELFLAAVVAIRRDREHTALLLERARLERLEPVLRGLPHQFPDR